MEFIKIAELEKSESDTDETVTYQHQCSECSHKIADHEYTFTIDGEYQVPLLPNPRAPAPATTHHPAVLHAVPACAQEYAMVRGTFHFSCSTSLLAACD